MNVRLEHAMEFTAGSYLDDQLLMNRFYIKIEMLTLSYDGVEQNIALDRIRHMLYREFSHSIFIDSKEKDAIAKYKTAGFNVIELPEVAVDQIIGIMLYCKLNAITEAKLTITQLKIASDVGQNLWYLQDSEEEYGPFEDDGWWHDREPNTSNRDNAKGNIIQINKKTDWHQHGLDWSDSEFIEPDTNVVAFTHKDEQE